MWRKGGKKRYHQHELLAQRKSHTNWLRMITPDQMRDIWQKANKHVIHTWQRVWVKLGGRGRGRRPTEHLSLQHQAQGGNRGWAKLPSCTRCAGQGNRVLHIGLRPKRWTVQYFFTPMKQTRRDRGLYMTKMRIVTKTQINYIMLVESKHSASHPPTPPHPPPPK